MEFDRTAAKISASKGDWDFLRRVAVLKAQTPIPALGLWRQNDDEFLWRKIVSQICNRGGVGWSAALKKKGLRDEFDASVSAAKLRTFRSDAARKDYVARQMESFHVGRFREDNAQSVVANLAAFADASGHLAELRRRLDELDCTTDPIGPTVQAREREARTFMMGRLVFYQKGQKYHAKRKPPSDFLINVGFARTLIPFDSRMKSVFEKVFALKVSEETNYELIENFFLSEVYPALHITPAQFDRIIFNHYKTLKP